MSQKIKVKGYKTVLRNKIIETLEKTSYPISATEISNIINVSEVKFNKSSFYRQLQALIVENIVQLHSFSDGINRYENTKTQKQHHPHLLCSVCKINKCVIISKNDLNLIIKNTERENNVKITNYNINFAGICKQCST